MPIRQDGKLLPRSKYERSLKLQAQVYALRFLELKEKVCAKDRDKVERAFIAARLEAEALVPERIDYDEERYREKYKKLVG